MGYMCHHAVLVTSWDDKPIEEAHALAVELASEYGLHDSVVSPLSAVATNGYRSFAVFPDGSKEGWEHSHRGDGMRALLLAHLDSKRHSDGSSCFDWCLVQYGDDDGDNRMLRHEGDKRGGS
jgi:hypothetical protein